MGLSLAACGGGVSPTTSGMGNGGAPSPTTAGSTDVPTPAVTVQSQPIVVDDSALGRALPDEGGGHVAEGTPIEYKNNPPASGLHYAKLAEYGVYTEAIPAPYWVHNLEHGAIVVLYNCLSGEAQCAQAAEQLRTLYQQLPPGKYGEVKLVATPYPELRTRFAVLAWNRILELDAFDAQRITEFYETWVDKGPEDVP